MNRQSIVLAAWMMVGLLAVPGASRAEDARKETPKSKEKIRVAVVGDSLSSHERWPVRLAGHLGPGYEVKAFTANGLTVIPNAYRQIWNRYEYRHALDYNPNVVLLAFGANAGKEKPGRWRKKEDFIAAYKRLIGLYKRLGAKPKIHLCLPTWPNDDYYGIYEKTVKEEIMPTMKQIAKDTGTTFIDANTPLMGRADVMSEDHVYSNDTGNEIIARAVYTTLTGKKMPTVPVKEPEPKHAPEEVTGPIPDPVKKLSVGEVIELKAADAADPKGDGPDGKGNTPDDTWGFWFELAHTQGRYHRLDLSTATMPAGQKQRGIPRKVRGPVGAYLPNPKETEGWIYHSDWDGRFEGIWGDKKAGGVVVHPYNEKAYAGKMAITCRLPAGVYAVSAKVTDLNTFGGDVIAWRVEVAEGGQRGQIVAESKPFGDKVGAASDG